MIKFHHREFELAVREDINNFDLPIEEPDLLQVEHLDCSNFDFLHEDLETLEKCKALKTLHINIGMIGLDFLSSLPMLEDLYLVYWGRAVDFRSFSCLHKLKSLFVSGGDYSSIPFVETDSLTTMKNLSSLTFHEFGAVDLSFLEYMPWLEEFFCGWANEVSNISSIGRLVHLKSLSLMDIRLDNLDFLDNLPDTVELDWSVKIAKDGYAPEKLHRFCKSEIRSAFEIGQYIEVEVEPK
ncbi:MAG: hypothetical protein IKX98_07195 [Clostridia bacterium]|nr:hypothetical protein [Clostridia bacterium]